jgi:hypothetical protein
VGAVSETGAMMEGQVPWHVDAGTLVHERGAMEGRTKESQPEKPPAVTWFRRP